MRKLYATLIFATTVYCANAQYTTLGTAVAVTPNVQYRLTPVAPTLEVAGAVWNSSQVSLASDFIVHAELNFGSFNDVNQDLNSPVGYRTGADGIAFVLAPAPYLGMFGEEIGYGTTATNGLYEPNHSMAIEMDTWQNLTTGTNGQGYRNHLDPAADHLAFMSRGQTIHGTSAQIGATVSLGELEDGAWHDVVIQWDATAKELSITLDGGTTYTRTISDLATITGTNLVNWGFTAATGSATNLHQVRFPQVSCQNNIIPCGKNEKKVLICHKPFGNGVGINGTQGGPNVLCIPWQAVPAHLAHGDCLGDCSNLPAKAAPAQNITENTVVMSQGATVYPNPSRGQVSVNLGSAVKSEVMIVNARGVTVERRNACGAQNLSFDLKKYGVGVYLVKVVTNGKMQTTKVIVQD